MMSLSDVLSAVLPVFCLALIGIGLRRVRWLTEEADATLLRLVVNVLTPCLIFDKVLGNRALQRAENLFIPPTNRLRGHRLGNRCLLALPPTGGAQDRS